MTWDLSVFYKGFDDPALRADIDRIQAAVADVDALLNAQKDDVEKLEDVIAAETAIETVLNRAYGYVELTLAADSKNADALRCLDELSNLMVDVRLAYSKLTRYIGGVEDLEGKIARSETLKRQCLHPARGRAGGRAYAAPPIWKNGCCA